MLLPNWKSSGVCGGGLFGVGLDEFDMDGFKRSVANYLGTVAVQRGVERRGIGDGIGSDEGIAGAESLAASIAQAQSELPATDNDQCRIACNVPIGGVAGLALSQA